MVTLAVGLLAGLGAALRHLVDQAVRRRVRVDFPLGILVVNASGSFVLGLVVGLGAHHGLPSGTVTSLSAGLCGGYTTWSTFAADTVGLVERGHAGRAALNVTGSLAVGLLAAAAGLGLALLGR